MSWDMCYIATDPKCGHIVAAVVDNPARLHAVAHDVAGWLRDGFHVQRVHSVVVKDGDWCTCQRRLPGEDRLGP
jgi:hypothetical protein